MHTISRCALLSCVCLAVTGAAQADPPATSGSKTKTRPVRLVPVRLVPVRVHAPAAEHAAEHSHAATETRPVVVPNGERVHNLLEARPVIAPDTERGRASTRTQPLIVVVPERGHAQGSMRVQNPVVARPVEILTPRTGRVPGGAAGVFPGSGNSDRNTRHTRGVGIGPAAPTPDAPSAPAVPVAPGAAPVTTPTATPGVTSAPVPAVTPGVPQSAVTPVVPQAPVAPGVPIVRAASGALQAANDLLSLAGKTLTAARSNFGGDRTAGEVNAASSSRPQRVKKSDAGDTSTATPVKTPADSAPTSTPAAPTQPGIDPAMPVVDPAQPVVDPTGTPNAQPVPTPANPASMPQPQQPTQPATPATLVQPNPADGSYFTSIEVDANPFTASVNQVFTVSGTLHAKTTEDNEVDMTSLAGKRIISVVYGGTTFTTTIAANGAFSIKLRGVATPGHGALLVKFAGASVFQKSILTVPVVITR